MSCCKKAAKDKAHKGCSSNNDDCHGGTCNPFYSQCPICAAAATAVVYKDIIPQQKPAFPIAKEFFTHEQYLISNYHQDILRPPQSLV